MFLKLQLIFYKHFASGIFWVGGVWNETVHYGFDAHEQRNNKFLNANNFGLIVLEMITIYVFKS